MSPCSEIFTAIIPQRYVCIGNEQKWGPLQCSLTIHQTEHLQTMFTFGVNTHNAHYYCSYVCNPTKLAGMSLTFSETTRQMAAGESLKQAI